jgi:inward rectifier potassium channel
MDNAQQAGRGPVPASGRFRRVRFGEREVITHGLERRVWQDLYHYAMTVSWPRLFLSLALAFLAFNVVFSLLYYAVPGCVANLNPEGLLGDFFFSVETLATVGYGDMHPQTLYGHSVAAVEIFIGMISVALVTGVMFARFSRPTARFLFAKVAVVRPMDGRRVLMFRAANARQNIIMEASAQLRLIREAVTAEGYRLRRVEDLKLVRDTHPLFVLGWNLMHVIDETSPLASETSASLAAVDAVFNLTLSGTDETTGQVLMARFAYRADAIRWNHTFRDIITTASDGVDFFDYGKFHEADPLYEAEIDDGAAA